MRAAIQVSTPQQHGTGWRVRSSTHGGYYFVHLEPLRCTCPAWVYGRGQLCKHLKAVLDMEKEVAMVG